jgi:hypothetical protein
LSDPTLSWVPTVTGDEGGSEGGGFNYTGVALIATAFGSLISGVVTSITGLVVALRKPREAASEADGNKTQGDERAAYRDKWRLSMLGRGYPVETGVALRTLSPFALPRSPASP